MMLLVSGSTRSLARFAPEWPGRLGCFLSPAAGNSVDSIVATQLPWAIDNGAYSGFNPESFRRLLVRAAGTPRLLWIACPDVVADARATSRLFAEWAPELRAHSFPVAYVAQDGQEMFTPPWEELDAWFIGGSTRWKLSWHSAILAREAKARDKWVHMGRVNSFRRLQSAYDMGCDSVDGSSASLFGNTYIPRYCAFIEHLLRQSVFSQE